MIAAPVEVPQPLTHLLKGVFAYSYSGYHAGAPGAPQQSAAPEIGSYLERTRPFAMIADRSGWEIYEEIDGYDLVDYVGWIDFHGDGRLNGGGTWRRAGGHAVPFAHTGSYIVENVQPPTLAGGTVASSCVILTHADASAEATRELKFTMLDGEAGKFVASGTMVQG
jgi:hypothetical protein